MSQDKRNNAAAANGWRPHTLLKEEAAALHDANNPTPSDMRAPHGWALSIYAIPMREPPTPTSCHWREPMPRHYWARSPPRSGNDPHWQPRPVNYDRYAANFHRLPHEEMTTWTSEGPPPSPRDKNAAGRWAF